MAVSFSESTTTLESFPNSYQERARKSKSYCSLLRGLEHNSYHTPHLKGALLNSNCDSEGHRSTVTYHFKEASLRLALCHGALSL